MIVYNVTVVVEPEIIEEWRVWMREVHLPEVLATGRFLSCSMFRIHSGNEGEAPSFSIQYQAATYEDYEAYLANEAPALKQKTLDRYGEKVLAFRTILEHVETLHP